MSSIIHVANLSKHFGATEAVRDISFTIKKGEIVGFVGPNGAGKSTTIALLLGFIHASKGEVTIFGKHHIRPETAHRSHRRIGYIAGDMPMFDSLTGSQYLSFMGHRFGIDTDVRARLEDRLEPQLDKRIKQLSRGNKQKISLIAALQHNPDLIIMDEPTSGLDPLMQETFLSIIREEAARDATVFMSSHILSEVAQVCSRVMFMKRGRIVSDQAMEEIEKNAGKLVKIIAGSEQIKALLASIPKQALVLTQTKNQLVLRYDSDLHEVLRWLSTKKFDDLEILDRQLDDLFIDFYKDEEGKRR
ncbi:ABC transporter ATP-binding protein [Candidatus Saccharibacteria bacterium]|nr:MAG: ABC transporter ATP-binding protein [Candidatus Saccharibacteria bacterium]